MENGAYVSFKHIAIIHTVVVYYKRSHFNTASPNKDSPLKYYLPLFVCRIMKEIFFKFLLRPTAGFSPEIQILVNQPLQASFKKLTNSLHFARRASKERDASEMPILIWLSPLFDVKVRAVKEAMRPFEPPSKAVGLTIDHSELYICTSCQLKGQGRPPVLRANPNLWVPMLLPRGGGRQELLVH